MVVVKAKCGSSSRRCLLRPRSRSLGWEGSNSHISERFRVCQKYETTVGKFLGAYPSKISSETQCLTGIAGKGYNEIQGEPDALNQVLFAPPNLRIASCRSALRYKLGNSIVVSMRALSGLSAAASSPKGLMPQGLGVSCGWRPPMRISSCVVA